MLLKTELNIVMLIFSLGVLQTIVPMVMTLPYTRRSFTVTLILVEMAIVMFSVAMFCYYQFHF